MKKQNLTKKEIKKIKKKLKKLYASLEKFDSKKDKKEALLLEQLEIWDQQLRPYEAAFEKAKKLSLIHISEPTRRYAISYAVFCLKKK